MGLLMRGQHLPRRLIKTDNKVLSHKLDLRSHVLREAGIKSARVLDLCAGEGRIWQGMRARVKVAAYTPCDRQPRLWGSIKGDVNDPTFLEAFDLAAFNVIDVDTYGEPWQAWSVLAPRLKQRTAVFLTCGMVGAPGSAPNVSSFVLSSLGIPTEWNVPRGLALFGAEYCLASAAQDVTLVSAWRVRPDKNVIYYGLVADPK